MARKIAQIEQFYFRHYNGGESEKRSFVKHLIGYNLTASQMQNQLDKWNKNVQNGHYSLSDEGKEYTEE